MKKIIFALTCLFLAIPCRARIIYVDANGTADFNNIQAAINAASNGDEIEVAPGTYYEAINFNGKAVRLYSSSGPAITTIDGTGFYRVVQCISGEDANTVLEGFTITGGSNTPPPEDGGGAMRNSVSNPTVINCTFSNNSGYYSGGIENWGSNPSVVNCTLTGNTAFYGGGMFNNESSNPTVTNCTFSGNLAQSQGGGMYNEFSNPTVTNCTFTGNSAEFGGGMLNLGNPSVTNCTFKNNSAVDGGGMQNWGNPTVTNCLFSNNTASLYGGGMYNGNGSMTLTNCTFSGNSAHIGGGIFNYKNSPIVTNCILWDNTPDEIVDNQSSSTVSYSDIQGGWPGLGNIDVDPCFADSSNDDYHLKSRAGRWEPSTKKWVLDDVNSPCIDTGDPNSDWTKELWPHGKRINMGAYGGTPQASMSPRIDLGYIADLNNDDKVDSSDLKLFTKEWQNEQLLLSEDLDRNGFVDFSDFVIFGLQWSYPSASELGMTFHIDDCNMEAGLRWTAAAESNEPRFKVWVEGRYIYFEDQIYANCCPDELGLDKEINGNEIILYEIGYGGLCYCMCYFPIMATLGPFEDGTYTVEVYDNYGNSLGVVEVTIGDSTGPTIIYKIEDCKPDASGVFAAEPPDQTRFTVTVEGLYIHFEDIMTANCCPDELGLEMSVEDDLITIYETEYTSEGCRCVCFYPVTAMLGPFEPGTYTLEVYEYHGGFIGSTSVVIDPPK